MKLHSEDLEIQHRRIWQLLKELCNAVEKRYPNAITRGALDKLVQYLQIHCSDQEQFMTRRQYPAALLADHHRLHTELLERISSAQPDAQFLTDLRNRLEHHLNTEDKEYLDYFRQQAS